MKGIKLLGAISAAALTLVVLPSVASAGDPETVLLDGPPALSASSTATFSFEAGGHDGHGDDSDDVSFQCRLDSDGAWEQCSSPVTYEGLADGPHRFEVRAVSARRQGDHRHGDRRTRSEGSGRCSDPTPLVVEFTVDTTPPATVIDAAPAGTIETAEATLEFSSEEDATFECRLDAGAWAECASPATFAGLADGPHAIEVRSIDAAGNVDPDPAVATFRVDTSPPETTVDTAPSARIEVNEALVSFSSPQGSAFECRLDPQPASAWEPCDGSVTLAGLAEGWHTFEVRARDSFGRPDPTPAVVTFFVDIPVNGARLAAAPLAGTVRIKTPGAAKFRPLTEGETIPVNSVVDTTAGKVSITSVDQYGEEQRASFFEGTFKVEQQLGKRLVNLQLLGTGTQRCAAAEEGSARASAASKSSLWGSGKGHFRTQGNFGAATVRGTIWLTEDTCAGTFFKVNRGIVSVRDFPRRKTIAVPAGRSYLARNPAG